MHSRVLLVEDDFSLRLSLAETLKTEGYAITAVASAEEAEQSVGATWPDVAILDWNLPGKSGLELLRQWRAEKKMFPVIFLSGRASVSERVEGLRAGASDYMSKPFAAEELMARVEVQLRDHTMTPPRGMLSFAEAEIDLDREEVRRPDGQTRQLTSQEAQLMSYFATHPRRVIPRAELLREVWGFKRVVRTRAVDNTVLRLRAKIESDPSHPRHVITVHGTGYRFEP